MAEFVGQERGGGFRRGEAIAVVGAGAVGATIAYALMHRGLTQRIYITDLDLSKADAQAKDLNHGRMFVPSVEVVAAGIRECKGADIVVITAGAKQKHGQSRLDLTQTNVDIFRKMIPEISAALPNAILLVVSNPVDVLTYAAMKFSGGKPGHVLGSGTVLDTARFRFFLGQYLNVSVSNVHAYILGEHGESEVPIWSRAHVGMIPLNEFAPQMTEQDRHDIFHSVRGAAGEIIAAKGATNWAIGLAVARIVEAIVRDERAVLTVSRLLDGFHGVRDVCLSAPSIICRTGVCATLEVQCDEKERAAFQRSAEVIRQVMRDVGL